MTECLVGTRDDQTASKPLYRRVLGNTYDSMPEPLQRMHDLVGNLTAEGFGGCRA